MIVRLVVGESIVYTKLQIQMNFNFRILESTPPWSHSGTLRAKMCEKEIVAEEL
jgi:hypothetical protein